MQRAQIGQPRPATMDLAVFGLNVAIGSPLTAVQAAFLAAMALIRLPAAAGGVQAVSYSPLSCGGRGRARLRLPAALAQAVLAAAPRLSGFCPEVSVDVWRKPEERQWIRRMRPTADQQPGRADRAATWRQPSGTALRPAAPAFQPSRRTATPPTAQRCTAADGPATATQFITATHPTPTVAMPAARVAARPATAQPAAAAAAAQLAIAQHAAAQPATTAATAPAQPAAAQLAAAVAAQPAQPAAAQPATATQHTAETASEPATQYVPPAAPAPSPTGPDGELEYTVEAFVAARRVNRHTEYLVKWLGYEMVGEEAAYSWQSAAQLQQDLDRRSYRRFLQQLRQARGAQPGSQAAAAAAPAGC